MANFKEILEKYNKYHPDPKEDLLKNSYDLAEMVYYGEKRKSGNDWMSHALGTADIVVNLKMDTSTICSALLHDSYKFGLTGEDVENEINTEVRNILDNLDSIKSIKGKYDGKYNQKSYSEYLRRLIMATSKDVRAVVLRLSEKLNSLSTVEELNKELQENAVSNALNIYAPLADLVGVYDLKWRLEDSAFEFKSRNLYYDYQKDLESHFLSSKENRDEIIKELSNDLKSQNIFFHDILGRQKKIYSYHKKIQRYSDKYDVSQSEARELIRDKVAFMIILEDVESCYKVLDLLHKKHEFLEDDLDDYIANPKPNGYRSLQTTLEIFPGHFTEIQIKTKEMHEFSEYGPASHVYYKMFGDSQAVSGQKIKRLKQLLNWKESIIEDKSGANIEEVEDSIFVFTPKGDIIELPKGSTPVDFAYKIHTKVGDQAGSALVNDQMKSLDYPLGNGDVVKIITSKQRKGPSRDWLDFVKSKDARINIKKRLRGGT